MDGDPPSESVIIAPLFPRVLVGAISGVLAVVLGCDPVHRLNGEVTIQRTAVDLDEDQLVELHLLHRARRGLNKTEAQLLFEIAAGRQEQYITGNADTVALGKLRNAGLVTGDRAELSDDVVYSLALGD